MYNELFEDFYKRYEHPEVEELTIGFSGIDPPLRTDILIPNHEQLADLLGGDEGGHYHLTEEQLNRVIVLVGRRYPPEIAENQRADTIADEEMTPYEIQGENVRN